MDYKFDAKDVGGYELLKEGEYEVVIETIEIKTLQSGKEKIGIKFRVRSDVEQDAKGRIVFEDIWKEKENPQYFNRRRLNQLLGTQHLKDGVVFEGIEGIIEVLKGAYVRIKVAVQFSEYRKEDENKVS